MNNKIYSCTFHQMDADKLITFVKSINMKLVDIRPAGKIKGSQELAKSHLSSELGRKHVVMLDLSDFNRHKGSAYELKNIFEGTKKIANILKKYHVLLMCDCWQVPTTSKPHIELVTKPSAHLTETAKRLASQTGAEWISLSPTDIHDYEFSKQTEMFNFRQSEHDTGIFHFDFFRNTPMKGNKTDG